MRNFRVYSNKTFLIADLITLFAVVFFVYSYFTADTLSKLFEALCVSFFLFGLSWMIESTLYRQQYEKVEEKLKNNELFRKITEVVKDSER